MLFCVIGLLCAFVPTFDVVASSPAEFRAFLKEETERLAVAIRNANLQLD